ncbi:MAG TPA: hypothetical protein VG897_08525 [Terriglobales bacterium]|nr:hypothetical protein [Terriglobales bacterium]
MNKVALVASLWLVSLPLSAQWFNWRTTGIPRLADGKPNLTAPAPRTADGKPDLSGTWQTEVTGYRFDVIQDLKDESIFRPAAEALFLQRVDDYRKEDPVTNCLPGGPSEILNGSYRIMQSPTVIALLFEGGRSYRQIHMDGRTLPEDPNPTWAGYSVGHWEGDTLVVESSGFNDRSWLDRAGHPHSEKLRVTERFHRADFGHMQVQVTLEDPDTLTRPLNFSLAVHYTADSDMLENVCGENNRDRNHMVAIADAKLKLSDAVLSRYIGTYAFHGGNTTVAAFMGHTQKVALVNGRLFMNALPLLPQSETVFDSTGSYARFELGADGKVTRLVLGQTEGDAFYEPVR